MRIFRHMIADQWDRLHKKGVRIKIIGDISKFAPDIREGLEKVIEQTKNNKKITAIFALNYGGRDELLRTINSFVIPAQAGIQVEKFGSRVKPGMTEDEFSQHLDTKGIPDPELIIRPGGEQRLSGFLLWQSEYSELYFPTWYMPDFTPEKLDEALDEYQKRQRRFGQ